jgi:hypothetical protein
MFKTRRNREAFPEERIRIPEERCSQKRERIRIPIQLLSVKLSSPGKEAVVERNLPRPTPFLSSKKFLG